MSLNADILTLNSALQAFTYGQNVVAENIANVNTPGYTTQVLNLESLNDFGGVGVAGVGSARNTFLYSQIYGQLALQGFTTAQLSALNQLYSILPEVSDPTATTGLNGAINNLASAWTALAADPASTADQTTVLNDMQTLANLFNTDANQLYTLQQNLNTQISQAVTQVDSLEDQILSLNKQIVALGGQQSAQTSTLIDQREVDAEALTGLTGANVNYDTDGAMVVTFNGGTLVDGVQSYHLGTLPSNTTPGLLAIGYVAVPGSSQMADVTADITNGTLGGLLFANNTTVNQAVLALNQMASGVINYSNEINESTTASDGSVNALFYGSEAADISVNPTLQGNLSYLITGDDAVNPGNLAAIQGAMTSMNMYSEVESFNTNPLAGGIELNAGDPIDPTASLASQAGLFANPAPTAGGTMVINAGGNAVNVNWTNTESLNQIIAAINAQGGGAIHATLQTIPNGATVDGQALAPGQYVHIYSNAPLDIYDTAGNLSAALQLTAVLFSSAPINAVPTTGVNQVNAGDALDYVAPDINNGDNPLALFTQAVAPPAGGTVEVNGDPLTVFTWNPNDTLNQVLAMIQAAGTTGASTMYALFNQPPLAPLEQVALYSVPTPGSPIQSVGIDDLTGNLTQVLNLNTNTNATKVFSQLTTSLGNNDKALTDEQTQANNLVQATQALQTKQSGVDENAQLAQAMLYENAYDAAVRMQYVLENMLNYLITQVGTQNGNSSPIGD